MNWAMGSCELFPAVSTGPFADKLALKVFTAKFATNHGTDRSILLELAPYQYQ